MMSTFLSKQAWGRWWRDQRYNFNAWQVSQLDDSGVPKSRFSNCFGTRTTSAYYNLNQIGIERIDDEKKKLENMRDDSNKAYDDCVLAEKQHVKVYKRKFATKTVNWTKSNQRENALALKKDTEFLQFRAELVRLRKKTNLQQKETNKITRQIEKLERYKGQYQVIARQISEGDEKLDINKHMKNLLPMYRSVNFKLDSVEDTQYIDEIDGIVKEIEEKEDANEAIASGVSSPADELNENELAGIIAMLMGPDEPVSKGKSAKSVNNHNNNNNYANGVVLNTEDVTGYDDEDEEDTLFVGAQLQKKKNKSNGYNKSIDEEFF